MTVQLGVANNHINKCIIREWFKKSEKGVYIVQLLNFGMFACSTTLTLIWVDFLGVRFVFWGNIGPSLKLVRITLEV